MMDCFLNPSFNAILESEKEAEREGERGMKWSDQESNLSFFGFITMPWTAFRGIYFCKHTLEQKKMFCMSFIHPVCVWLGTIYLLPINGCSEK